MVVFFWFFLRSIDRVGWLAGGGDDFQSGETEGGREGGGDRER